MNDFRAYWLKIFARAWADTIALFPFGRDRKRAVRSVVVFLLASLVLYAIASEAPVIENWSNFASVVAATFVVGCCYYLINFMTAPHRIDREKSAAIFIAEQKLNNRAKQRAVANPLRAKIAQIDQLIEEAGSSPVPDLVAASAMVWEGTVIGLMRKGGVAEKEIHMFETISNIPNKVRLFDNLALKNTLEAKKNKLRLIISRLLDENGNDDE